MLHSAHIVRRRLTRDSRSVSCKASNRRLECASVLLVLVRAQARIASKLSMPCSSTCSHEDHARHHAVQAGSHAVHVDGRLSEGARRALGALTEPLRANALEPACEN